MAGSCSCRLHPGVEKDDSNGTISFNEGWEFVLSADSASVFSDDPLIGWEKVMLPHTPVIEPLIVNDQWQGVCWYRKTFTIPEQYAGKQFFLKFEGAMNVADAWVNGRRKITHLGGYLPFMIDFTAEALPGQLNQVIVRLDNTDNPITGPKPLKLLDFNTYGGLYRDVTLHIKNLVYITDPVHEKKPGSGGILVTYPEITAEQATIRVMTHVRNAGLNQEKWDDLLPEERTSRQLLSAGEVRLLQQATNVQEAHNDNLNTPAFADGYWVMFDYNRGYADDLESSGIMSIDRLPKFSYHFFRSQRDATETSSLYSSGPMVFIASYWNEASPLDVGVFSHCEEVELWLNGELISRQAPDRYRMSNHLAHPPFTFRIEKFNPGTLSATGFIGGRLAARHEVNTAGEPAAIKLTYDESRRPPRAGCQDVIFVYAHFVDERGIIVLSGGSPVRFTATGAGKIINTESSLSQAGIASALLRIGNTAGTITVTATAQGFPPSTLELLSY